MCNDNKPSGSEDWIKILDEFLEDEDDLNPNQDHVSYNVPFQFPMMHRKSEMMTNTFGNVIAQGKKIVSTRDTVGRKNISGNKITKQIDKSGRLNSSSINDTLGNSDIHEILPISHSERKRYREKQRRIDVNIQYKALISQLRCIGEHELSSDSNMCSSDEESDMSRVASKRMKRNIHNTDLLGCRCRWHMKSNLDNMNRADILARTVEVLDRLRKLNTKRKKCYREVHFLHPMNRNRKHSLKLGLSLGMNNSDQKSNANDRKYVIRNVLKPSSLNINTSSRTISTEKNKSLETTSVRRCRPMVDANSQSEGISSNYGITLRNTDTSSSICLPGIGITDVMVPIMMPYNVPINSSMMFMSQSFIPKVTQTPHQTVFAPKLSLRIEALSKDIISPTDRRTPVYIPPPEYYKPMVMKKSGKIEVIHSYSYRHRQNSMLQYSDNHSNHANRTSVILGSKPHSILSGSYSCIRFHNKNDGVYLTSSLHQDRTPSLSLERKKHNSGSKYNIDNLYLSEYYLSPEQKYSIEQSLNWKSNQLKKCNLRHILVEDKQVSLSKSDGNIAHCA